MATYLDEHITLLEIPPREVPFWDFPGLMVLLLFVFSGVSLVVRATSSKKLITRGPTAGMVVQGDLVETVVDAVVPAAAAADEVPWPTYESPGGFDDWLPPPVAVPPLEVPPALGPHVSHLVSLPWGYLFWGGTISAGLFCGYAAWRAYRRREYFNSVGYSLFLPAVAFVGGVTLVGFTYGIGWCSGWFAPPRTLLVEWLSYLRNFYVPGYRAGAFSSSGLLVDLYRLSLRSSSDDAVGLGLLLIFRSRWFTWTVAAGVVVVLVDHLVSLATRTTDLAEYERLLAAHKEIGAEMARISQQRLIYWEDHPPDDPAVQQRLTEINELMCRMSRRHYTVDSTLQVAHDHGRPFLSEFTVQTRRTSFLDRGIAQAERLVSRVR